MKRSRALTLLSMGASVLALTACGNNSELLPAKVYASVEECVADGARDKAQCETAMMAAEDAYEAAYPKFESEAQCEDIAGEGNCEKDRPSSRDHQWRPSMVGFLIGSAIGSRVQPQPVLPNASSTSGYSTAAGVAIVRSGATASVPASAAARATSAQVTRVATSARGGFGSSAVAHASTGGSRSGG